MGVQVSHPRLSGCSLAARHSLWERAQGRPTRLTPTNWIGSYPTVLVRRQAQDNLCPWLETITLL